MNKNHILKTVLPIIALAPLMTGCARGETKPLHECSFYPVEAKEATCVSEGNIAYDQCIYCKKIEVNGEEKTAEDVILPIDPNNHKHLVEHDALAATCITAGNKAYSYCEDCNKYVIDGATKDSLDEAILAIDPNAHHLVDVAYQAPDCGHTGIKAHKECDVCHKDFVDGSEVSKDSLIIPVSDSHTYDENGSCSVCHLAFKYQNQEFSNNNQKEFKECSQGPSFTDTSVKEAVSSALLEERMTFNTQLSTDSTLENSKDSLIIKHTKTTSNTNYSFTRIAPGKEDEEGKIVPYVGKFLFSFDVSFKDNVYVERVGAMIADNTFSVVKGDGITQSLLIGRGAANKNAENKADREFEAGATYRFIYSMETTDENQLLQIFACSAATEITLSNMHLIPLSDASNVVKSSLLYFGKNDMAKNEKDGETPTPTPDPTPDDGKKDIEEMATSNPCMMYKKLDFFSPASWTSSDSTNTARDDSLKDSDGNLVFTSANPSRIDLFHVLKANGSYKHPADKAANINGLDIFDKDYRFDLDIKATGAFDTMVLGSSKAYKKSDKQNSMYLSVSDAGNVSFSLYIASPSVAVTFNSESIFDFNKVNRLSIVMNRKTTADLELSLYINYKKVVLTGDAKTFTASSTDCSAEVNSSGTFFLKSFLSNTGLGQRLGIMPASSTTVTISGLGLSPTPSNE